MELATKVQIQDVAICFSLCTNALRKGMNPSIFSAKEKQLSRLGLLMLVRQPILGEGKVVSNQLYSASKNDLVSYPLLGKGIGWINAYL